MLCDPQSPLVLRSKFPDFKTKNSLATFFQSLPFFSLRAAEPEHETNRWGISWAWLWASWAWALLQNMSPYHTDNSSSSAFRADQRCPNYRSGRTISPPENTGLNPGIGFKITPFIWKGEAPVSWRREKEQQCEIWAGHSVKEGEEGMGRWLLGQLYGEGEQQKETDCEILWGYNKDTVPKPAAGTIREDRVALACCRKFTLISYEGNPDPQRKPHERRLGTQTRLSERWIWDSVEEQSVETHQGQSFLRCESRL